MSFFINKVRICSWQYILSCHVEIIIEDSILCQQIIYCIMNILHMKSTYTAWSYWRCYCDKINIIISAIFYYFLNILQRITCNLLSASYTPAFYKFFTCQFSTNRLNIEIASSSICATIYIKRINICIFVTL